MDQLVHISKTPYLARCVRSLVYMANVPYFAHEPDDLAIFESHERDWAAAGHRLSEEEIRARRAQHRKEAQDFDEASLLGIDFLTLKEVIPLLSGLTTIAMYGGVFDDRKKTPFQSRYVSMHDSILRSSNPEGCRELCALLEALGSSPTTIQVLKALELNWKFFDQDLATVQRLFLPVSNLRSVRLGIDAAYADGNDLFTGDFDTDGFDVDALQCYRAMDNGVLRTTLESLGQLEVLNIDFPVFSLFHEDEPIYCARLDQVLSTSHRWNRLRALALGGLEAERQDLMAILNLHKDTLRTLILGNITLVRTSWLPFLVWIRKTLKLDRFCLYGVLRGSLEDGTGATYDWVPANVACGWRRIDDYCTRRSNQLPLYPQEFGSEDAQMFQYAGDFNLDLGEETEYELLY
ncbi:hypothetical protein GGS26DRAFT_551459 [Hypomontagnella submonticulosa]|nr:hypothetical protein GGS26DRAFT_551459 [Hypomontagnella submonticulosa]